MLGGGVDLFPILLCGVYDVGTQASSTPLHLSPTLAFVLVFFFFFLFETGFGFYCPSQASLELTV